MNVKVADIPVLFLSVDVPLEDPKIFMGISAINGCDLLFFDVLIGKKYFCNVANPGDAEVVSALRCWDKAGYMPVMLHGPNKLAGIVRRPFEMNPVYEQVIADSARPNFLKELQQIFRLLLEPNCIESLVRSRHQQPFESLNVGFVATKHSDPGLDDVH